MSKSRSATSTGIRVSIISSKNFTLANFLYQIQKPLHSPAYHMYLIQLTFTKKLVKQIQTFTVVTYEGTSAKLALSEGGLLSKF